MRFLKIEPDDSELFQSIFDKEKQLFLLTHLEDLELMWKEQGTVFWLRFLVTFDRSYQTSKRTKGNFDFLLSPDGEKLLNCIFIHFHKQFVDGSCITVKKLLENMLVAAKHFSSLKETNLKENPYYMRESKEAFANIIGKPDDENIPFQITAFLCLVCFEFSSALCVILKRWLQATDLTEKEQNEIDNTAFYWQPFESWNRDYFYSTCFEQYLVDYWGEDLSEMLLHSNVYNLFSEHEELLDCCDYNFFDEEMNVFELFKELPEDEDYNFEEDGPQISEFLDLPCIKHAGCFMKILHDDGCIEPNMCEGVEPCKFFCIFSDNETKIERPVVKNQYSIKDVECLKPTRTLCKKHNKCYMKVCHFEQCPEPYFCQGTEKCKVICKTDFCSAESLYKKNIKSFFQKVEVDVYSCKNGKRNVATLAQSNSCIQTHFTIPNDLEEEFLLKQRELTYMDELPFYHDPDIKNSFNQYKKKQQMKSRLKTKLCKRYNKYASINFEDSAYCIEFYRKAMKTWQKSLCQQNFQKIRMMATSNCAASKQQSLFGDPISIQKAMTSIAVGTDDILTGRVVHYTRHSVNTNYNSKTEDSQNTSSSTPNDSSLTSGNRVESKSKKKRKKNKAISNDGSTNKILDGLANADCVSLAINTECNVSESPRKSVTRKETLVTETEKHGTNDNTNQTKINGKALTKVRDNVQVPTTKSGVKKSKNLYPKVNNSAPLAEKVSQAEQKKTKLFNNQSQTKCKNSVKNIIQKLNETQEVETASNIDLIQRKESTLDSSINESFLDISGSQTKEDKAVNNFLTLIRVLNPPIQEETTNSADNKSEVKASDKKMKLRTCAYCGKNEIEYRTFKRCSRCKVEKFAEQRYYCSRECQVNDWEESHREEHQKKNIVQYNVK